MKIVEIISPINRGGFGRVDKVLLDDGRIVARKTFAPAAEVAAASGLDKLRRRFVREVKVQKELPSDFFIPIIGYNLEAPEPFFLMPLVHKTLRQQIVDDRKSGAFCKEALLDILNALEHLHLLEIVHRDLTPANVMFHEGRWKLADFGLVLPPSEETVALTTTHSAWGSTHYCAPEQAQAFGDAKAPVDIYAFGCILHDMVMGSARIPYAKHTAPGPFGDVIEKCTEGKPERRFRSVESLRDVLVRRFTENTPTVPTREAAEWAFELDLGCIGWDPEKMRAFVRYIRDHERDTRTILFQELGEAEIEKMLEVDEECWDELASLYFEWTDWGFDFAYCDVIIGRLEKFYDLGSVNVKAQAVLAAAKLATDHNRWAVMRRVLKMCAQDISDDVARRIALEIRAGDLRRHFVSCVDGIGEKPSSYHPKIAEALATNTALA